MEASKRAVAVLIFLIGFANVFYSQIIIEFDSLRIMHKRHKFYYVNRNNEKVTGVAIRVNKYGKTIFALDINKGLAHGFRREYTNDGRIIRKCIMKKGGQKSCREYLKVDDHVDRTLCADLPDSVNISIDRKTDFAQYSEITLKIHNRNKDVGIIYSSDWIKCAGEYGAQLEDYRYPPPEKKYDVGYEVELFLFPGDSAYVVKRINKEILCDDLNIIYYSDCPNNSTIKSYHDYIKKFPKEMGGYFSISRFVLYQSGKMVTLKLE